MASHEARRQSSNILDDEVLIATLGESKITSTAIGERLELAAVTEAEELEASPEVREEAMDEVPMAVDGRSLLPSGSPSSVDAAAAASAAASQTSGDLPEPSQSCQHSSAIPKQAQNASNPHGNPLPPLPKAPHARIPIIAYSTK